MKKNTLKSSEILTDLMLTIFRINAKLLEKGDILVSPLGITSARWQVMGAIALADTMLTCPQIASAMGMTRQGALKQLKLLSQEGLVHQEVNPKHERSPLYRLTDSGQEIFEKAMHLNHLWTQDLAQDFSIEDLTTTIKVVNKFEKRLYSIKVRGERKD